MRGSLGDARCAFADCVGIGIDLDLYRWDATRGPTTRAGRTRPTSSGSACAHRMRTATTATERRGFAPGIVAAFLRSGATARTQAPWLTELLALAQNLDVEPPAIDPETLDYALFSGLPGSARCQADVAAESSTSCASSFAMRARSAATPTPRLALATSVIASWAPSWQPGSSSRAASGWSGVATGTAGTARQSAASGADYPGARRGDFIPGETAAPLQSRTVCPWFRGPCSLPSLCSRWRRPLTGAPTPASAGSDLPTPAAPPAATPPASTPPATRAPPAADGDRDREAGALATRRPKSRPALVWVPLDLALWKTASINHLLAERAHNLLGIGLGATEAARVTGVQIAIGAASTDEVLWGIQLAGGVAAAGQRTIGIQVAGLVGAAGARMAGAQAAGLVAASGREAIGLQLGGLVAASGGYFGGIQIGGLVAGTGASFYGLQIGGLLAGSGKHTRGIQLGGLMAGSDGELRGLQIALGLTGARTVRGGQLAGGFAGANRLAGVQLAAGAALADRGSGLQVATTAIVERELTGVQLALVNVGGEITGAQIGLVNVARSVRGVQLGLVNIAESVNGAPIGAISYVGNGPRGPEAWADSSGGLWAGYRSGSERVYYSMLSAGVAPRADGTPLWAGAGGGVRLPIDARIALEPNLLLSYVRLDAQDGGSALRGTARLKLTYRLATAELLVGLAAESARSTDDTGALVIGPSATRGDGDARWRLWPSAFAGARL